MEDNSHVNRSSQSLFFGEKSSLWRSVFAYGIVLAFIGLCVYYFYAHREDFAFLAHVSLLDLAAASLCVAGALVAGMFQLKPFLDHYLLPIRILELGALATASTLGNLVLPLRGGTAALAFYLKRIHGMSFGAFSLTYAGTGLLAVLANSAMAMIGLAVLFLENGFFNLPLTVITGGLLGLCLLLILFRRQWTSNRGGIWAQVEAGLNAWHTLTRHRLLLAKSSAAVIAVLLCISGSFYFLYRALGVPLPFSAVLVTLSVGSIATLFPITPGALGVFDAVTIQIPIIFGLDVARSMTATVLFRAIFFLWAFGVGIPGFLYLSALVRRHEVAVPPMSDQPE